MKIVEYMHYVRAATTTTSAESRRSDTSRNLCEWITNFAYKKRGRL